MPDEEAIEERSESERKKKEESGNDKDDESAEERDGNPSGIANLKEDITNT